MQRIARLILTPLLAMIVGAWLAAGPVNALAQHAERGFDGQALDSMLAPVALYPDQLLSQVLMAATYPHEVEEAARWSRARPGLSGDAAVRTSAGWDWDPSVHSLTAFPDVLDTMVQHMRWTQDLGEAFLAQPQDVMDTVQRLRFRAYEAGTLASTEYTRVIHTGSSLIIESVQPRVVHVPHYDPRVVYGSWWWPAFPPVHWARWHGYYDPPGRYRVVHWGPGVGLASGFFFGTIDWPRREVHVVNDRGYYRQRPRPIVVERPAPIERHAPVHTAPEVRGAPGVWRHNGSRRRASPRHDQHAVRHAHTPRLSAPAARLEAVPSVTAPARTSRPAQHLEIRQHKQRNVRRAHTPRLRARTVRREAVSVETTRVRTPRRAQAETRQPAARGNRGERHERRTDRRARN